MRVLVFSQSPRYRSGMGRVGDEIAKELSKYHEVLYQAQSGAEQGTEYHGYELWGNPMSSGDPTGTQILSYRLRQTNPDFLITNLNYAQLTDISQITNNIYMNQGEEIPTFLYTAVESQVVPPNFHQGLLAKQLNDTFYIPFTEPHYQMFNENEEVSPYVPDWIPHGKSPVFEPKPSNQCEQFLVQSGVDPDDFVFLFVGENYRRKRIDKLVQAFSILKNEKDVGDVSLILHTSANPSRGTSPFFSGWDIASGPGSAPDPMLDVYDLDLGTDVYISKHHAGHFIPDEQLALMYSASDCFVMPTSSEGFCMPLLESMACGTPCIATDLPETRWLCQDSALYVNTSGEELMRMGEVLKTPSAEDMAEKMEQFYDMADSEREKMAENGTERAEDFSWRRTGREFVELIDRYRDGEL